MERKYCEAAQFKLLDGDSGGFTGYGSTFGNFDRSDEAVAKGAFADTLPNFKRDGFIAIGHDWSGLPVATVKDAVEDDYGLLFTAEFHSTPAAQDARRVVAERLERGKSVGLSIGYSVKDSAPVKGGIELRAVDLYEVSIVTVPCNPRAMMTGAKGEGYTFADHSDAALAVVKEFITRAKSLRDLRAIDNRQLSAANLAGIKTLFDECAEMQRDLAELLDTERPKANEDDVKAARALRARALGLKAQAIAHGLRGEIASA